MKTKSNISIFFDRVISAIVAYVLRVFAFKAWMKTDDAWHRLFDYKKAAWAQGATWCRDNMAITLGEFMRIFDFNRELELTLREDGAHWCLTHVKSMAELKEYMAERGREKFANYDVIGWHREYLPGAAYGRLIICAHDDNK